MRTHQHSTWDKLNTANLPTTNRWKQRHAKRLKYTQNKSFKHLYHDSDEQQHCTKYFDLWPLLSSRPLTTMCASSSCSCTCSESSLRVELRNWLSTCWTLRLSVVARRKLSAPALIFSSLRISLRILSRCSSNLCWTLESDKSEFWSRPSCSRTDRPSDSYRKHKRGHKRSQHKARQNSKGCVSSVKI